MRRRVVFVGESSPSGGLPFAAVRSGDSAHRFARYAGVTPEEMREVFEFKNLCHRAVFHADDARQSAALIRLTVMPGNTVVLLGARVAAAFGESKRPLLERFTYRGEATYYRMPHPSGRCRWWNDSRNVSRARGFLARLRRAARCA